MGIAGSANAARIDVITDSTLTEFDATLGVRVIKANQTWTSDNQYILSDRLFIKNGQTLTIQPGTKIYGSTNTGADPVSKTDDKVGSLIACRGGRLVADGTKAAPIVFNAIQVLEVEIDTDLNGDSIKGHLVNGQLPSSSTGGLWGGVVLLGNSYISQSDPTGLNIGKSEIEGFLPAGTPDTAPSDGLADAITYGFDAVFPRDDADDSGIIRYVSIRHGGYEFSAGREINGLTMGGVGSGTTIEFVEVYANTDDGFEFFGGTVSTRYLVSAFNQDDSFDFDTGHTGKHQFLFSIQNPGIADGGAELDGIESTPSSSTNQGNGQVAGLTLSKPIFYNMTIIGPGSTNIATTIALGTGQVLTEKGNVGFTIEDHFNGEFYNSVFHDFTGDLVNFRDGHVTTNPNSAKSTGSTIAAGHNTIGVFGGSAGTNQSYITNTNFYNLFYDAVGNAQNSNSNGATNPLLRDYTRTLVAGTGQGTGNYLTTIDPRPQSGSPLLGATLQAGAPVPVLFRGAFGDYNWLDGWSFFDETYDGIQTQGLDDVAPVIALIGAAEIDVVLGSEFTDPGAIVSDYPEATRTIVGSDTVNTSVAGEYEVTYNYTDAGTNAATQVTRIVNVGLGNSDTTVPFTTAPGAPLDISDYFQTGQFEDADVVLVGSLPKGMKFNADTKAITGYPTVNGTATFTVTLPGEDPVELEMTFTINPVPAAFLGTHVLHTDDGDAVTVAIGPKGTSVSILDAADTKAVKLKAVLFYDSVLDEWTIDVPASDLEIVLPTIRTLKEDDDSFLGDYGTLGEDELWGFKASTGTGAIVLSKAAVTVTITGVVSSKGVSWSVTPTGGKAIKSIGSISADGIASINTTVPGPGELMGMFRVEEELDEDGVPTGELNVALLQGLAGWTPVSYTP